MILINQEEVIEVAAHLFCGRHGGLQQKLLPVFDFRAHFRQNGHLDPVCQLQLRADAGLFGGVCGHTACIIHDTALHLLYLMVQVADLIIGSYIHMDDVIPGVFPVHRRKSAGRIRQLLQRIHRQASYEKDIQQDAEAREQQDKDDAVHQKLLAGLHDGIHIHVGADDGDGLAGFRILDRHIGAAQPSVPALVHRRREIPVIFHGRKLREFFFDTSQIQKVLVRIHQVPGDPVFIILDVHIGDDCAASCHLHIVGQDLVIKGQGFVVVYPFSAVRLFAAELLIIIAGLLLQVILHDVRIAGRKGCIPHRTEFFGEYLVPE